MTKQVNKGQILVSGFQHDARHREISVNTLPPVSSAEVGDSSLRQMALKELIIGSNVAKNIRDKNPQIDQTEDRVRLQLFVTYSLCPSKNNCQFKEGILDLPRDDFWGYPVRLKKSSIPCRRN